MSLADELIKEFEPEIEALTLKPAESGQFEVTVNDKLIFSKLQLHRHAEPGEVAKLIRKVLHEGV